MPDFSKHNGNVKHVTLASLEPIIREQLSNGGSAVFTVKGVSMSPLLKDGKSEVQIVPAVFPLRKYQIPLYKRADGQFVLHRIIRVKKNGYVCRGDHQVEKEEPVTDDMVIGILHAFRSGTRWRTPSSPLLRLYAVLWVTTARPRAYLRAAAAVLCTRRSYRKDHKITQKRAKKDQHSE